MPTASAQQRDLSDLTVVIPTHQRAAFLRRLIHYFEQMHLSARLLIVDSSDSACAARNLATAEASPLSITYLHMTCDFVSKCCNAVHQVSTPLMAFCADDDFLLPDGVQQCVAFLRRSPDYSTAQGMMVSLCTKKDNRCYALAASSIEQADANQRFQRMATYWFSTFYSVCRTTDAMHAWETAAEHCDYRRARIFPEILLSQMSVLSGRVRYIPCLYNIREEHDLNESAVIPEVEDASARKELYEQFRTALAVELDRVSSLDRESAGNLVDDCYGFLASQGGRAAGHRRGSRLARAVTRTWFRLLDRFDTRSIRVRRRLSMTSRLSPCRGEAWDLAHRLMVEFPQGLGDCEVTGGRRGA